MLQVPLDTRVPETPSQWVQPHRTWTLTLEHLDILVLHTQLPHPHQLRHSSLW